MNPDTTIPTYAPLTEIVRELRPGSALRLSPDTPPWAGYYIIVPREQAAASARPGMREIRFFMDRESAAESLQESRERFDVDGLPRIHYVNDYDDQPLHWARDTLCYVQPSPDWRIEFEDDIDALDWRVLDWNGQPDQHPAEHPGYIDLR